MKFLLISILITTCVSCTSYPKRNNLKPIENGSTSVLNPYFANSSKDYIYKANITAFDKDFGGVFIVKKLGPDHHRVAFTTELGNKIFDFTFYKDDFKVNHILKEMNRKLLLNILRNDFRALIKEDLSEEKTFSKENSIVYQTKIYGKQHFYFLKGKHLHKITKVKHGKEIVEFLFSEINDDLAQQIEINHKNLRLSIRLKSI